MKALPPLQQKVLVEVAAVAAAQDLLYVCVRAEAAAVVVAVAPLRHSQQPWEVVEAVVAVVPGRVVDC